MGQFLADNAKVIADVFDILSLWCLIYISLRFLRGSRGLEILRGLLIILVLIAGAGFALSRFLDRPLIVFAIYDPSYIGSLLLAIIIVFQPEIRRGFRRLGEYPLFRLIARTSEHSATPIASISEACIRMARRRTGALIVIERITGIRSITEQGVNLSSRVDALLLETIFNPEAPLHDGAVIIRGDRLLAACCFFPLTDAAVGRHFGTRHRAAIGVTEETDAVAVVVSEESGEISIAQRGELITVEPPSSLEKILTDVVEGRMELAKEEAI